MHAVSSLGDEPGESFDIQPIPNAACSGGAALASRSGTLHCVFRQTSGALAMMSWDGNWSAPAATGMSSAFGPALAAHRDLLVIAFAQGSNAGVPNQTICYSSWDGETWSPARLVNEITAPTSTAAPALATWRGRLHLLFVERTSGNRSQVAHYLFGGRLAQGQPFLPQKPIPSSQNGSAASVSAVAHALGFDVAWVDQSTVRCANFDASNWSDLAVPSITNASECALGVWHGALELWSAHGSSGLARCTGVLGGERPVGITPLCVLAGQAFVDTDLPGSQFTGVTPYTIEAWARVDDLDGTQYIVSCLDRDPSSGLEQGPMALALRDGKFAAFRRGQWITGLLSPAAGSWHHVTSVFDGGSIALYVDGVLEAFENASVPVVAPARARVRIGAASSSSDAAGVGLWQGRIRQVVIWSIARQMTDVQRDLFGVIVPQIGLSALVDFGGSNPIDRSGHGAILEMNGTPGYETEGFALALDGAGGLECGSGLAFTDDEAATFAAWVNPAALPAEQALVLARAGQYALGLDAQGWFGSVGDGPSLRSTTPPAPDRWTHVALTRAAAADGGATQLFVDGAPVASGSAGTSTADGGSTTIGCAADLGQALSGRLATVQLWRRCLDQSELRTWRALGPIDAPGLAANYDFSAPPARDITLRNPRPTTIGSGPSLNRFSSSCTLAELSGYIPSTTSTNSPYVPWDRELERLERVLSNLPAATGVALPPDYVDRSVSAWASTWPAMSRERRAELLSNSTSALGRAADAARAGVPLHGHRFEWITQGDERVLLHHTPDGATAGIARIDRRLTSAQVEWWIEFALALIFGFAGVLGLSLGSAVSEKLFAYFLKHPRVFEIIGEAIDFSVEISAGAILKTLQDLWEADELENIIVIIGEELSYWTLIDLLWTIGTLVAPGASAVRVATMLYAFGSMAVELTQLALRYPR